MDLKFIFRVLRHRWITIIFGLIVASAAALFAGYKVSSDGLESRADPQYEATSRLIISTPDRSVFASGSVPAIGADGKVVDVKNGYDPNELADIYAFLVVSDNLRPMIESRHGPLAPGDSLSATRRHTGPDEANDPGVNSVLPILEITARSRTADGAKTLAVDASEAFTGYIADQQAVQNVPPELRVDVQPLELPNGATDTTNKNTGTVALVFAAIAGAFIALAFARENSARTAAVAADPTRWINVVVPIDTTASSPGLHRPAHAIPETAPMPEAVADEDSAPLDGMAVAESNGVHERERDDLVPVDARGASRETRNVTSDRPKPRRRWPRHRTR